MQFSLAYLGPSGSYTHEAAMNYARTQDVSLISHTTISDVFNDVLSGSATHGVVPIENSTNGSVTMTFDLFRDLNHDNLKVCGEEFVSVKHALLGQSQLGEIERIYSHPQVTVLGSCSNCLKAFGQCELFLHKHLKGVERINVSSTSKAAQLAADDPKSAAIASRICADIYQTGIIAEDIQDTDGVFLENILD